MECSCEHSTRGLYTSLCLNCGLYLRGAEQPVSPVVLRPLNPFKLVCHCIHATLRAVGDDGLCTSCGHEILKDEIERLTAAEKIRATVLEYARPKPDKIQALFIAKWRIEREINQLMEELEARK